MVFNRAQATELNFLSCSLLGRIIQMATKLELEEYLYRCAVEILDRVGQGRMQISASIGLYFDANQQACLRMN